ncbi:hypothetical protein ACR9GP_25665 [Enterobacter ludwigii]
MNVAHAFCHGWGNLAFLRGLMGLSGASSIPAGVKCNVEWFPAKESGIVSTVWKPTRQRVTPGVLHLRSSYFYHVRDLDRQRLREYPRV